MKEILPDFKSAPPYFNSINTEKSTKSKELLALKKKNQSYTEGKKKSSSLTKLKKTFGVGTICSLKVTALGPKGVGIDEFSYGFSILIPKAPLGKTVKVQIKRIFNFKKTKYAIASLLDNFTAKSVLDSKKKTTLVDKKRVENTQTLVTNLNVGDVLTVKLSHIVTQSDSSSFPFPKGTGTGSIGLATYEPTQFTTQAKGMEASRKTIIIPLDSQVNQEEGVGGKGEIYKVGQEMKIKITKIKLKYIFAQLAEEPLLLSKKEEQIAMNKKSPYEKQLTKGSKITLTLPKSAKKYAKHMVILLKEKPSFQQELQKSEAKPYVLFLQNLLNAKFGDKVRVKFTKVGLTFAVGKILRIAPNSALKKLARARKDLNEMLINEMHYGEKVVKCQAKMRNYLWTRKNGKNRSDENGSFGIRSALLPSPSFEGKARKGERVSKPIFSNGGNLSMGASKKRTLQVALPLGKTQTGRGFSLKKGFNKSNSSPLIKKGRHLINLLKTRRCLNIGLNQLTKYAAKGRTFLFVGTKKPASGLIARAALFTKTSFFVNTRWLGGILTNWKTIVKSITKVRPILKEKQLVILNILQKRLVIRNRLIKKVLSLKEKSQVLIKKGKQLIEQVKGFTSQNKNVFPHWGNILIKRKALFARGQLLLEKRQNLLKKQNSLKEKTLPIKETGFLIANKYKLLLNKLTVTHTKLHDIRLLFILNKELRNITKLGKEQGKNQYTLPDEILQQLFSLDFSKESVSASVEDLFVKMSSKKLWFIPNPPQEIFNKICMTLKSLAPDNSNSINDREGLINFNVKEKNDLSLSGSESNLKQSIVLTTLLSKFSRFLPYIKNSISSMLRLMQNMAQKMTQLKTHLKFLKGKLAPLLAFNLKINGELKLIQEKYTSEQLIIRILRRKLKRHEAEKKVLQFLPKLRYLPTPKSLIALAVQVIMKRFVDPKMKYPMDFIYDEKLKNKSKKVAAARKKKWQRLETYFGGIANMTKLNKKQISNNVAIIVGQQEEMNAVLECKKLGIKMFHIVDTNCNPGLADHFIPSNDDSRNSIKYILTKIVTRIRLAQKIRLNFKSKKKVK